MASKDSSSLSQLAGRTGKVTRGDRATTLVADIVAAAPVIGPLIAAGVHQLVPMDSFAYISEFAKEAAERIDALDEEKIDRDYIQSDGFRADLEQVLDAQTLLAQRRKRGYFLAALVRAGTVDRPADHERQRMLDTLIALRLSHLDILAVLANVDRWDGGDATGYFSNALPNTPLELVELDWKDLAAQGIVGQGIPGGVAVTPFTQRLKSVLTGYGERFKVFIDVGHFD